MSKQMLSEHIPIKLFNAMAHVDGDTIDHTSEGEPAADLETVAGKVTALENKVGEWDSTIWEDATGVEGQGDIYAVLNSMLGDYDKASIAAATSCDGTIYTVLDSLATEVNYATFDTGAPTMAVAASKTLTISTKPTEGATVSMGGVTYKFRATSLGAGAAATGTLDMTAEVPHATDALTLGTRTYQFVSPIGTAAGNILIEETAAGCVDNLVACIMGTAGDGTKYVSGAGTNQSATLTAARTDNTMVVTQNTVGFAGNIDSTSAMTHGSWGATTLVGGVDAQAANDVYDGGDIATCIINLKKAVNLEGTIGTHYGTGTVVNPLVEIPSLAEGGYSATTITARNKVKGVIGNATAIDQTLEDGTWAGDASTLAGGINGTVAAAAGKTKYIDGVLYTTTKACTTADSSGWNVQYLNSNVTKTLDLSGGTSFTMTATDGIGMIIVTETDGTDGKIVLPPATGSLRKVVVSIQKATNNIVLDPAAVPGSDTIDTASNKTVTALSTVTLLDYATGKWMSL